MKKYLLAFLIYIIILSFNSVYANETLDIETDAEIQESISVENITKTEQETNNIQSTVKATSSTIDDLIKSLNYEKQENIYNINLNTPFSKEAVGASENVNIETGDLSITNTLLNIPGRNNLDLNLELLYSSRDAKLYNEAVEKSSNDSAINVLQERTNEQQARDIFGTGWRLSIPYLEKLDDTIYITLPSKQTYIADLSTNIGIKDYKLKDITFSEDNSVSVGDNTSSYVLSYKDGHEYYFKDTGELILEKDKFNNRIHYFWTEQDDLILLTQIKDSTGTFINLVYDSQTITIWGNNINISIHKDSIDNIEGKYALTEIRDNIKRVTRYKYNLEDANFDLINGTEKTNKHLLLTSILFENGTKTNYTYLLSEKNLTSQGSYEYYRLKSRYEKYDSDIYNLTIYDYMKQPDGYPIYKNRKIDPSYTYSTTVTNQKGLKTTYKFNNLHLPILITSESEENIQTEQEIQYRTDYMLPTKQIEKLYNDSGDYNELIDIYDYNNYGQIVLENHSDSTETKYSYDSAYGMLLETVYKKDDNTIITSKNMLSNDKKNIVKTSILENDIEVAFIECQYDEIGNVIRSSEGIDNFSNKITEYIYDDSLVNVAEMSNIGITNVDSEKVDIVTKYSYDRFGNLVLSEDANKNQIKYKYDLGNRIISLTNPDNTTQKTNYDDKNNIVTFINEEGLEITYKYNPLGLLETIEIEGEIYLTRKYDEIGNITKEIDANGNTEEYTYDIQNRIIQVRNKDKLGVTLRDIQVIYDYAYKENNKQYLKITTIEQNRKTEYLYDLEGKLVRKSNGKNIQEIIYDNIGNVIEEILDGDNIKYKYDALGNVIETINFDNTITKSEYNMLGDKIADINELGIKTKYKYDELGRLIQKSIPFDGQSYSKYNYYYDDVGNLIKEQYPNGNKVTYEYDEMNRQTKVIQSNMVTETKYNALGNISEVNFNGNIEKYKYNFLGQVIEETDTYGNVVKKSYDKNGNITLLIDKNGVKTRYTYDGLNRLIKTTNDKDGLQENISYNIFGEIVKQTANEEMIEYEYDEVGNKVKEIYNNGIEKNYTYNQKNDIINLTIKQGSNELLNQTYTYNKRGQVEKVRSGNIIIETKYDKAGRILEEKNNQSDLVTSYNYYPNDKIKQILYVDNSRLQNFFLYKYDFNGNIIEEVSNDGAKEYKYDELDRIKVVQQNDNIAEYNYDLRGNISQKIEIFDGIIQETKYNYDQGNRLTSLQVLLNNETTEEEYKYDNQGNLIQKIVFENGTEEKTKYLYNGNNQMNMVLLPNNKTVKYTYGIDGIRNKKIFVNEKEIMYINENGDALLEITLTNNEEKISKNIYQNGIKFRENNEEVINYIHNGHGDIVNITTNLGKEKQYEYDVYGRENDETNYTYNPFKQIWEEEIEEVDNPYRYAGYYYDEETGFYYLRARYYDPSIERFTQEDPIKDGDNWYVYCNSNPVKRVDPNGLKDFIYTSKDEYYVENDWGFWDFLHTDKYFAEIEGIRYEANSIETVELYDWNLFDTNFLNETLDSLIAEADQTETDIFRVFKESINGDLDFKNKLEDNKLYLADEILYNKNEAGNFVWAYFLESHGISGHTSGALAQGGSLLPPIAKMKGTPRLDEEWDRRARWDGVEYYYERNDIWWLYFILYKGDPHI